jgi:hypothetical protein
MNEISTLNLMTIFSLIRTGIVGCLISAFAYALLFYSNAWLTSELVFSSGVNWIYLPAGLRLFLTLIFGLPGAIGIGVASFLISYAGALPHDLVLCIGTGVISGFAPYLARLIIFSNIKLEPDLSNLSLPNLLVCIFLYALLCAGLHQAWYRLMGLEDSGSLNHFAVMFVGDVLGSLLLISLIKASLDFLRRSGRLGRLS